MATASGVRNWLLIEHDGPWGRDAFVDARLSAGMGAAVRHRARIHGVRPILIRRAGRRAPGDTTVFAVHSGPNEPWIERLRLEGIGGVLDLDLEALGRGTSVGGERVSGPRFLVCTHGRHDPCCAERGRPLAAAMAAALPDGTWECSHIGGDRFAANLVIFPHGLYYGRIEARDGTRVARAYLEGRIDLDHYRGRSCYPVVAQAAEHFVRAERDLNRLDDVEVRAVRGEGDEATVVLQIAEGRLEVRVGIDAAPAQRLTCHADRATPPPRYRLLEVTELNGGGSGP